MEGRSPGTLYLDWCDVKTNHLTNFGNVAIRWDWNKCGIMSQRCSVSVMLYCIEIMYKTKLYPNSPWYLYDFFLMGWDNTNLATSLDRDNKRAH